MRPVAAPQAKRFVLAALLLLPLSALALSTSTTRAVNMRTGPDRFFEVMTVLPARTSVRVTGCIASWRWCQVVTRRYRGWVDSRYLQDPVRGRVPVVDDRGSSRPPPARQRDTPVRPAG